MTHSIRLIVVATYLWILQVLFCFASDFDGGVIHIEGMVRDPQQQPVANAKVAAGKDQWEHHQNRAAGTNANCFLRRTILLRQNTSTSDLSILICEHQRHLRLT
jgi:hypothetical protein